MYFWTLLSAYPYILPPHLIYIHKNLYIHVRRYTHTYSFYLVIFNKVEHLVLPSIHIFLVHLFSQNIISYFFFSHPMFSISSQWRACLLIHWENWSKLENFRSLQSPQIATNPYLHPLTEPLYLWLWMNYPCSNLSHISICILYRFLVAYSKTLPEKISPLFPTSYFTFY